MTLILKRMKYILLQRTTTEYIIWSLLKNKIKKLDSFKL